MENEKAIDVNQIVKIYSHDYDDSIKLNVICIDKCNYTCSYCFNMKGGHKRTNEELNLDKVFAFANWLNKKTHKHINISLIGGEPTLHSQFEYFSQLAHSCGFITLISFSNFSKSYEFFKNTILNGVKYLLTFHYYDAQRTDDFINKLQKLSDENLIDCLDAIIVMLQNHKFDDCLHIYDMLFAQYGNKLRCHLLDDCDKDCQVQLRQQNYTNQQLAQYIQRCKQTQLDKDNIVVFSNGIQKEVNDYAIINNYNLSFKYWKCNAGKDYFHIDLNGNIYPCGGMLTKKLGTLDSYQHIQLKSTFCMTDNCCPCEYGLEKIKLMHNI